MFQTPFRFWVQISIGFAGWNSLTGSAQAQVLAIPAASDGGINSPNRLNKHAFPCEATETFRASWPRLTTALSFRATKSTDASTSASLKSSWNGLRHFSGNGSTTAVNMFQTPFCFWVQISIGFAAWNSLTGSAQAQVLAIPAANDGGINLPNRLNKHPFRCEATETFRASWPRLTAALSFPATKSTDASTSASLKSSWNGLRHFSGNGSTTAANMFQTPFYFWVQISIGFAVWNSLTGSAQAQGLAIPAANDGGINSPNRLNKHPFRCEATETFWRKLAASHRSAVIPSYQIDRRINIGKP
ncbi:hypothetical protein MRX96_003017 [Rhipicephalus microplus]